MPETIAKAYKTLTLEEQKEVNNFIYFIIYKRNSQVASTETEKSSIDNFKANLFSEAPITASLLGIMKNAPIGDYKSEIENAISEKYGY